MPCFAAKAAARLPSRAATQTTRPLLDRWIAGTTKLSAILAAPSTPQRIMSRMVVSSRSWLGSLTHRLKPLRADAKHVIRIPAPPVLFRKYLHLDQPVVSIAFDAFTQCGQVDDTVAHHAAVEQQVARFAQPVAYMERENP